MNGRVGHCYRLAFGHVVDDEWGAGHRLVHGTIEGANFGVDLPPNPHAWVVLADGRVWEPVTDQCWPADLFARLFGATVLSSYTAAEAARLAVDSGHYGPWDAKADEFHAAMVAAGGKEHHHAP